MNSRNQSRDMRHSCDSIKAHIKELRALKIPWRKISRMYADIPPGSLQMWVDGKRELADEHKVKLGLPIKIPTIPCSACGKVHSYDRACEKVVVIKDKPKPKKQRPRYPRYYCWLWEWAQESK